MPTITATYESRRDAELAIEHLAQELGLDRDDISVGPDGEDNSVGTEVDGADLENDGSDAPLAGSISVVVTAESDEQAEEIQELLEEFGCEDIKFGD